MSEAPHLRCGEHLHFTLPFFHAYSPSPPSTAVYTENTIELTLYMYYTEITPVFPLDIVSAFRAGRLETRHSP
jgi:hypothetical protein